MDKSGQSDIIEITGAKNVGVSYTLNNRQPVKCSYIGTDPLFFMDVDDALLEEEEMDMDLIMEMEDLDHNLDCLEQKLSQYEERFSQDAMPGTESRMALFEEDLADIVARADQKSRYTARMDSLLGLLENSRYTSGLLEFAKEQGVSFIFDKHTELCAYQPAQENGGGSVAVNPGRKLPDQILGLAGELRRIWQHKQGAGVHPLAFDPDRAVLVNRMQQADISVSMIRTAWELYLADYKSIWNRVENSSLNDVARAFAREAFLDFRTLNNGEAAASAFETWFLSERCRKHDKTLIQSMLHDNYALIFQASGGVAENAVAQLVCKLGEVPFGKNYLAQYTGLLMEDPLFNDVQDRSNANFLWFIKFEQSFAQTEHELQTSRGLSRRSADPEDISGGAFSRTGQKRVCNESVSQETDRPDSKVIRATFGESAKSRGENLSDTGRKSDPKEASIVIFPGLS